MSILRPYMTDAEVNLLASYIRQHSPTRCLEWGIGGSTIAFSQFDTIQSWLGIERNIHWVQKVRPLVGSNVVLLHIPRLQGTKHGSVEDIESYISAPEINGKFDFIFIDGDYRGQCIEKASTLISENGFCMVHDTARKYLHSYFKHFDHCHVLTEGEFNSHNDWHQGLAVLWNGSRSINKPSP